MRREMVMIISPSLCREVEQVSFILDLCLRWREEQDDFIPMARHWIDPPYVLCIIIR